MKKLKVFVSVVVGAALGVVFVTSGTDAHASEVDGVWIPRTVDQIKADIAKAKDNKYKIIWGDTLSGISQATNLTVRKLVDMNKIANVDLIYAGNTLVFEGNVVSVEDDKGETVAQTVIRPQDKNDTNKPVGKQEATNQAEEKAQETSAPGQSQTNQATNTPDTTPGTNASVSGSNNNQNGTVSSTTGTTAPSNQAETPVPSTGSSAETSSGNQPTQPSQPAEKPTTPTQPSTGGEQGGTTKPSETPKPTEPTIVRGEIGNSAGMKDQNGNVVSGLWDDGTEANEFGNWGMMNMENPDGSLKWGGYETWGVYYSDGSEKTTVNFYTEDEFNKMAENWNN
ncbi:MULTISPECIES: LysM peptidoglycan-binding domain-containing protein [Enterococcus]|uniref:LysM peptidoglycan-binding domain-containing protein n=1 Tax=Enterococcus TaxID=1350 RepID=UPI0010FFA9D8|nr:MULTISPECIES: LysM domain-containing protein [Enterococcus]MCR1929510.1 LysM peptidoglycan-binding domain-containing protein [Enterococcus gallinarum]MCR1932476.1 LysM peptidoglycan-binding domain-containing protein [Enterococcus gallinarum]MCR1945943.1 LysM peptidoglycan-binding domain-containing protein [Enterococcus gallinarum]MDQ6112718.1 LysM peptidoglycan-binding domain-containing protein [Enterococcus gallinarum]QCT93489.1 LysM peptidoglycan-binding domain-containing protein [Enteroc